MSTTETTLLHLRPEQIAQHPDNPRDDVGDVTDLAASIVEVGLLEPIVVVAAPDGTAGKKHGFVEYLLIAGHRRLNACIAAHVSEIPALYRSDLDTRAKQIEAMLVENLHRVDLSPIEEANGYQLLIDITGLTQSKIAEHVGQPKTRVRDRLKLAKLPKGVQDRIHGHEITLTDAGALADLTDEPDLLKEVEKAVGNSDFAWKLERANRQRAERVQFRRDLKVLEASDVTVRDEPVTMYGPDADHTTGHLSWRWHEYGLTSRSTAAEILATADAIPNLSVHIDRDDHRVTWYCDKVSLSHSREVEDTDLPQSPEELDARRLEEERRAADQRQREELVGKLDAAAKVRREHIGGILHAGGNDDLAKRVLIRWLLEEGNDAGLDYNLGDHTRTWTVLAQMLRLAPETLPDARKSLVERKLNKLTLPALVLLTATWWTYDTELERDSAPSAWSVEKGQPLRDWIHTLTDDLAYPWSDFERDHIGLDESGHVPAEDEDDDTDEDGDS